MAMSWQERLWTTIVWILTVIACAYESWLITHQYMDYRTTTKVAFEVSENMTIPTFSHCVNTNWDGDNISEFFDRHVTLKSNPIKMFSFSEPREHGLPDRQFGNIREIGMFVNVSMFAYKREKCYTFNVSLKSLPLSLLSNHVGSVLDILDDRNQSKCNLSFYFLTPPPSNLPFMTTDNELFDCVGVFGSGMRSSMSATPSITWQRHKTNLLETPFDTDCRVSSFFQIHG